MSTHWFMSCDICQHSFDKDKPETAGATAWHQVSFGGGSIGLDVCASCRKLVTVHEVIERLLTPHKPAVPQSRPGATGALQSERHARERMDPVTGKPIARRRGR